MREIRLILYYRLEKGISADRTALALKVSKGTVINTLERFRHSGLCWPLPAEISDSELSHTLYPPKPKITMLAAAELPSVSDVEQELAKKHVTLQCLYDEYCQNNPQAVSRATFYRYVARNRPKPCSMPMEYKGGDLLFVDYSGDGLFYTNRDSGQIIKVELFCCCWGASSYSYAEATHSQKKQDFVHSHPRAFQYFGVVPHGLVPDNLKSGIEVVDRYDPIANPLYGCMARHHNTVILPARVCRPKDKAKIESGVLHIQRFILARLRNRQFFSLFEINTAIWQLLEEFNTRPMKDYGNQSRRQRFESLDRPYAQSLPAEPFRVTELKLNVLVGKNYHIRYHNHFYSVDYRCVGKRVEVRRCGGMVEIVDDNQIITRHLYSSTTYGYTTKVEHMPQAHQFVKGLTPGWVIAQAAKIGPFTVDVITTIMRRSEHVQQGLNAALGVLQLAKAYTTLRLEAACKRCLHFKTPTYRALKSVLKNNLDKQPIPESISQAEQEQHAILTHDNIRGNYR